MRACRKPRVRAVAGVSTPSGAGISASGRFCPAVGMTRPRAGRQEILSNPNASATARRAVPSVTAPGDAGRSNMLNEVGASSFVAIVDRHNCLAGSGDHR